MGGKNKGRRIVLNDTIIFELLIMAFFLTLAVMSLDYNPRARSVPFGIGIIGGFMTFLQLLADAVPRAGAFLRFIRQEEVFEKGASVKDHEDRSEIAQAEKAAPLPEKRPGRSEWWQVMRLVLWLVCFVVLLALINYIIAVGAFVFFVTRVEARESWKRSIALTLSVTLGFYVLFEVLLQTEL